MIDMPLKPPGGGFGWLVTVERNKGQRPERYYVAISDEQAAASKVRHSLRLKEYAKISFRYALSQEDVRVLKLLPGDVTKA
jgi:hypothetical protein